MDSFSEISGNCPIECYAELTRGREMISTSFAESDEYLGRPPEMTAEQCDPLSVKRCSMDGVPVVVSCWKITKDEMEEFVRTGRIWLIVVGETMPPVSLSGLNPFEGVANGEEKT